MYLPNSIIYDDLINGSAAFDRSIRYTLLNYNQLSSNAIFTNSVFIDKLSDGYNKTTNNQMEHNLINIWGA